MRFASIKEADQHEHLTHARALHPQDLNQKSMVQSQASLQNLKTDEERTMMQQMAIDNFDPKRYRAGLDNLYTCLLMNFAKYFYWERLLPVAVDCFGY